MIRWKTRFETPGLNEPASAGSISRTVDDLQSAEASMSKIVRARPNQAPDDLDRAAVAAEAHLQQIRLLVESEIQRGRVVLVGQALSLRQAADAAERASQRAISRLKGI